MITFRSSARFDKEATILVIEKDQLEKKVFALSVERLRSDILVLHQSGKFTAENEEIFPLVFQNKIVLLVGAGKKGEVSTTALRTTLRKALVSSFLRKLKDIEIIPHTETPGAIHAIIEAILLGTYAWKKYITKERDSKAVDQKNVWIVAALKKSYEEVIEICHGVNLTRDLVNDNADTVTSSFIEDAIKNIVKGKKNITLEILNQRELKAKGLHLHLAVNNASRKEPKLIIVKYRGSSTNDDYTAVVGKGITFDTGGLNLKPTGSMETMRTDMSGAAAVIGILKNILALKIKKNIIFAVTLAENAVGSGAYKPGDVIRGYNGKTVEIANTDAEGRLVLADAISYVAKNYKPARIIDLATLTGACVVALGHDYSGLMSNDNELARQLIASAEATDDRVWQLPVYPELKEHVKSQIADIKNTGLRGAAGALSGAEFLRQFTGDTPWAHLDIAGTAFVQDQGRWYFGHGATGAGVRLLTDYLRKN